MSPRMKGKPRPCVSGPYWVQLTADQPPFPVLIEELRGGANDGELSVLSCFGRTPLVEFVESFPNAVYQACPDAEMEVSK